MVWAELALIGEKGPCRPRLAHKDCDEPLKNEKGTSGLIWAVSIPRWAASGMKMDLDVAP